MKNFLFWEKQRSKAESNVLFRQNQMFYLARACQPSLSFSLCGTRANKHLFASASLQGLLLQCCSRRLSWDSGHSEKWLVWSMCRSGWQALGSPKILFSPCGSLNAEWRRCYFLTRCNRGLQLFPLSINIIFCECLNPWPTHSYRTRNWLYWEYFGLRKATFWCNEWNCRFY